MLKNIIKIICILLSFYLLVPICSEIKLVKKVDEIVNQSKIDSSYEGYLFIPKLNYRNLIKKGEKEVIDANYISLNKFSSDIGSNNNIILAGHNNRFVFHNLYYLSKEDNIILSDFKLDYRYVVKEIKYVKVDDYSIFDESENTLTLITCTNDNQKRLVVIAKKEEF